MSIQKSKQKIDSTIYTLSLASILQILATLYFISTHLINFPIIYSFVSVVPFLLGFSIFSKFNKDIKKDTLNTLCIFITGILSLVLLIAWIFVLFAGYFISLPLIGFLFTLSGGFSMQYLLTGSILSWIWLSAALIPLVRLLIRK